MVLHDLPHVMVPHFLSGHTVSQTHFSLLHVSPFGQTSPHDSPHAMGSQFESGHVVLQTHSLFMQFLPVGQSESTKQTLQSAVKIEVPSS